jgi:hypothetical protein
MQQGLSQNMPLAFAAFADLGGAQLAKRQYAQSAKLRRCIELKGEW